MDRDGDTFKSVINYLRNGMDLVPEFESKNQEILFQKEMAFWKIGERYRKQLEK